MAATWTHVLKAVSADDLESSELGNEDSHNGQEINSPRTDLVTFEPSVGLYWVIISIYCKADGADSLPKIRPYFYDAKQTEIAALLEIDPPDFWGRGDLIFRTNQAGDPAPTTDGNTERYTLPPLYIGNCRARFALEDCGLGGDLIVTMERVAIEQLPSY